VVTPTSVLDLIRQATLASESEEDDTDENGSAAAGGTTNTIQVPEEGAPAGRATQKKKQERMSQHQRDL
jgi:hypothetical protein